MYERKIQAIGAGDVAQPRLLGGWVLGVGCDGHGPVKHFHAYTHAKEKTTQANECCLPAKHQKKHTSFTRESVKWVSVWQLKDILCHLNKDDTDLVEREKYPRTVHKCR